MTRKEHLHFCIQCNNQIFDAKSGIICKLTESIADFNVTCGDFKQNPETISNRDEIIALKTLPEKVGRIPVPEFNNSLYSHQHLGIAIIGGLFSAIVSAILWAGISVLFQYQIGFMAIGVGMLVGISVRFFGAGIEKIFGIVGASLALLGCLMGNLFTQVGFIAHEENLPYLDVIAFLKGYNLFLLLMESFHPLDLLFYAIALVQGYRISFRKIEDFISTNNSFPPGDRMRFPLAYLSAGITAVIIFILIGAGRSENTFYYDSGEILSKGSFYNGLPNDFWTYFHENGNLAAEGNFVAGNKDGVWTYFDENGILSSREAYLNDLLHGEFLSFHSPKVLADSGGYQFERMSGVWVSRHPNGVLSSLGEYNMDLPVGTWSYFYDNGGLSENGSYQNGMKAGLWTTWDASGKIKEEVFYLPDGELEWINYWDTNGKQLIENGQGIYKTYYENGNLAVSGQVKEKLKEGIWNYYYEDGKPSMQAKFTGNKMELQNSWGPDGKPQVSGGKGKSQSFYLSGELSEEGNYVTGLKNGIWESYYEDGITLMSQSNFLQGKLEGYNVSYYEDGQMVFEGQYVGDKETGEWTWYHKNGEVDSRVKYVNGKKSGEQIFINEVGNLVKTEKYQEGVYIETVLP